MTDEINIISLFGGRKSLPTPTPFGPSRIPIPWLLYSVSCFLRVFGLVGDRHYSSSPPTGEERERVWIV